MINLKRMRRKEHVAHFGEMRNAYKIILSEPQLKTPFFRHGYRWEDNSKVDLTEIRFHAVYITRIELAVCREQWNTFVNTAMNRTWTTQIHVGQLIN
jgi:hypothetical protein